MSAENDVFSRRRTAETYLRVESALAMAQAEVGLIPVAAAEEIDRRCRIEAVDIDRAWNDVERTGYPIAPLVRQITGLCSASAAQYVHWGATTMDIMDTALALQVGDALKVIDKAVRRVAGSLANQAEAYRDAIMAGRTFGGHALPITFGFKIAGWIAPLLRHVDRLQAVRERVAVCQLGGAVGTLASLGSKALAVQAEFARRLGLRTPVFVWHTAHDAIAETVHLWAMIGAALGKAAADISLLSSTEVSEAFEPTSGGKDSSSTLPQKTNPIYSAQIIACAKGLAQCAALSLLSAHQTHERSGEGMVEFPLVAEAYGKTLRALEKMQIIADGMSADVKRMRANLDATGGQIMAESVMMALADKLGRLQAHDLLHDACMRATRDRIPLREVLVAEPHITTAIGFNGVAHALDPERYLGVARYATDLILREARRRASGI